MLKKCVQQKCPSSSSFSASSSTSSSHKAINETRFISHTFQTSSLEPSQFSSTKQSFSLNEEIYADLSTSKINRNQINQQQEKEPCDKSNLRNILSSKPKADPNKRLSCEELEILKERFVDFINPNNTQLDTQ